MGKVIHINSDLLKKVLTNGLKYPIEKNPVIGDVIKLTSRQAFSYAVLTSHGYLDETEPDNLFILTRDNFRVFNQVDDFDLQEGIFSLSDLSFVATVNNEVKRKPYLNNGDKFVLPIEYSKYQEYQDILKELIIKLKKANYNPNNFIIAPIRNADSTTSELESFFEYVVSTYFNRKMYLTDTQVPFYYGIGTPDIGAYKIPKLMKLLQKFGFIEKGGSVIDLMTISSFGFFKESLLNKIENESIVFEVKTNQLTAPQIKKYTNTKIFSKAYEVIPSIKKPESYAGLITINLDGGIEIYECSTPIPFSSSKQKNYFEWIEVYLKMYLLANLTTNELEEIIYKNGLKMSSKDLLNYVTTVDFEKMLTLVKGTIWGRK